jgi:hypothetical protein
MDDNGNPTGRFKASQDFVKNNLATIQKYSEIDFKKRTGMDYETYKSLKTLTPEELNQIENATAGSTTATFSPANYY